MKASKRSTSFDTNDIGGSFKTAYRESERKTATDSQDDVALSSSVDDVTADLYLESVPPTPIHHSKNARNRVKAIAIAQSRLDRLSEELLELADELRYLNPLMADALDTAWQSTDEALEILADDHAWSRVSDRVMG